MSPPARPPIHILLATYNGGRFLVPLLDSVLAQTDPEWILFCRDDGSSDGTPALLRRYAARDRRIVLLETDSGRLGICANFARLMTAARIAGAALFALCDQDDVWRPQKVARLRAALDDGERRIGAGVPLLAYADLALVDAGGKQLAPSHFMHAGAVAVRRGVGSWLLAHNLIPGCAMAANRALLDLALPMPLSEVHHDWWLAVLAAATGEVIAIDEVLTDYRQHGGNAIGAASPAWRMLDFLQHVGDRTDRGRRQYMIAVTQARELLRRVQRRPGALASPAWVANAHAVCEGLGAPHRTARALAVLCGPVRRLGFSRNVLMFMLSLLDIPPVDRGRK